MSTFEGIEDTLYIPLLGRIYATERFPQLLFDEQALRIRDLLPQHLLDGKGQNQYTYLASAVRAFNMDRVINEFLGKNPAGTIVNIGAGLDTTFFRVDNGSLRWFDLDLPRIIEQRKMLICETERSKTIAKSIFDKSWIKDISSERAKAVLIIAAGLFYYFPKKDIINLINDLKTSLDNCELAFDAISKTGLIRANRIVEKTGNKQAKMIFYVNHAKGFFDEIPGGVKTVTSYPYYAEALNIIAGDCSKRTKLAMRISDRFDMVIQIDAQLS